MSQWLYNWIHLASGCPRDKNENCWFKCFQRAGYLVLSCVPVFALFRMYSRIGSLPSLFSLIIVAFATFTILSFLTSDQVSLLIITLSPQMEMLECDYYWGNRLLISEFWSTHRAYGGTICSTIKWQHCRIYWIPESKPSIIVLAKEYKRSKTGAKWILC